MSAEPKFRVPAPLFTLKKEYYDAILSGKKTVEIRRGKRWESIAMMVNFHGLMTLQSGRRIHARRCVIVTAHDNLDRMLNLVPFAEIVPGKSRSEVEGILESIYGDKPGRWFAFYLGEAMP